MKISQNRLFQATAILCLFGAESAKSETKPGAWRGQSITEFTESENASMSWEIVNDGVMGGLSDGKLEFTGENTLKLFGELSLKNNGGFTTARSGTVDLNLSNDLGLLLRVRGDGRKYEARLESDSDWRGMPVSFSGEFVAEKGDWQQVKIPFSSFKGSFRGRDLPDMKLNPADVRRVWILLGDKKEGPFSMEVDWIRTYGKGQGDFKERKSAPAKSEKVTETSGPKNLIETAVADGRFTTFKTALDTARLTTFFQWDNKLTVFAPTNEAFEKLPEETLTNLLKPENKDQLVKILSYHVFAGEALLSDALAAKSVKTIEGSPLKVSFSDGSVRINNAKLLDADIVCSDGVIHAIDTVLMPPQPARKNILSTAGEAGSFKNPSHCDQGGWTF